MDLFNRNPQKVVATSGAVAFKYFIWLIITLAISRFLAVIAFFALGGRDGPDGPRGLAWLSALLGWALWFAIGWYYGGKRIAKYNIVEDRKETLNYFVLLSLILFCVVLFFNWSTWEAEAKRAGVSANAIILGIVGGLFLWIGLAYGLAWYFLPGRKTGASSATTEAPTPQTTEQLERSEP